MVRHPSIYQKARRARGCMSPSLHKFWRIYSTCTLARDMLNHFMSYKKRIGPYDAAIDLQTLRR